MEDNSDKNERIEGTQIQEALLKRTGSIKAGITTEVEIIKDVEEKQTETPNEEKIEEKKEEKKKKAKEKPKKEKSGKKINKKVVILIVIAIVCVVATVTLICLKFNSLNKQYAYNTNSSFNNGEKVEDDEKNLTVVENGTIDYNNIDITTIYNVEGVESTDSKTYFKPEGFKWGYYYVKIEGLKNKDVENKINEYIKNEVINHQKEYGSARAIVSGSFNSVLSLYITTDNWDKYKGINIDLNTGDFIPFEKVFIKSTPIYGILYNGVIEKLPFDTYNSIPMDEDDYYSYMDKYNNMDNRDTSKYEDVLFDIKKWYDNNKDNINYYMNANYITIDNIYLASMDKYINVSISLAELRDYVAIYKRYNNQDIFSLDKYATGLIPFTLLTTNVSIEKKYMYPNYGIRSNNLFFGGRYDYYQDREDNMKEIDKIIKLTHTRLENVENEMIQIASQNQQNNYFFEPYISIEDNTDDSEPWYYWQTKKKKHYKVNIYYSKQGIPKEEGSLSDMLYETGKYPMAGAAFTNVLNVYYVMNKKDMQEYYKQEENITLYFDENANYLGDTEDVVIDTGVPGYNPS